MTPVDGARPRVVDRRDQMLATTAAIAARLLAVGDPRTVMQEAVDALGEAIGCEQTTIQPYSRQGGAWHRLPLLAIRTVTDGRPQLLEEALPQEVFAQVHARGMCLLDSGRVCCWDDFMAPEARAAVAAATGFYAAAGAPIFLHGRLWGSLGMATRDPSRTFTPGELDALELTAQLFSAALARAEANDELYRRDAIMKAVARVATDVIALGSPTETSRRLVVELAASTRRPIIAVCRAVPGSRMMETVALHGHVDPTLATLDDRAQFADVVEAYRQGRHVVIGSTDLTPSQRAVLRKAGTTAESLLGTPVTVDGRLWGHIVVADDSDARPYSESEIEAIRIAAGLVAAAATRAGAEEALRESESMLLQSQKLEAIGLFAGGVAHDFSNTLMAVRGFASLIEEVSNEEEVRSFATHILDAAERSSGLLRRLLALARKDRHEPIVSDVGTMLGSLETLLAGVVPRNMALTVDVAPDTPLVEIDPGEFEQVVLNLVLNARDAIVEGGLIDIRAHRGSDGRCEVVVRDTGVGIDPEAVERIFDPFFTTKDKARGSGIGLTVVQGIVTRAGGTITARSTPGRGSVFTVALPGAAAAVTAKAGDPDPATPHLHAVPRARILLVEDDDRLRPALETLLRRRGYEVVSAISGEVALSILEEAPSGWSLLLTDVVMPGMDGRALALATRRRFPLLPVVLMSGYTFDVEEVLDGATFVPKHATSAGLLETVESLIGGAPPPHLARAG